MRRSATFSRYIGKEIEAKIIELDKTEQRGATAPRVAGAYSVPRCAASSQPAAEGCHPQGCRLSIVNFGAFVDLAASTAWLHVSELSWKHIDIRRGRHRWRRGSPSRCSTSTWIASGFVVAQGDQETRAPLRPALTPSARSCQARSPNWFRSVRSSASKRASRPGAHLGAVERHVEVRTRWSRSATTRWSRSSTSTWSVAGSR